MAGKPVTIREQVIDDAVTELRIEIEKLPSGAAILRLSGPHIYGRREFFFDAEGDLDGSGTDFMAVGADLPPDSAPGEFTEAYGR